MVSGPPPGTSWQLPAEGDGLVRKQGHRRVLWPLSVSTCLCPPGYGCKAAQMTSPGTGGLTSTSQGSALRFEGISNPAVAHVH